MKTISTFFISILMAAMPAFALAQNTSSAEAVRGKTIYENLQSKMMSCENLKDEDFEALGEYSMAQMMGASHEDMNTVMSRMMGAEGQKAMHRIMGRQMGGCGTGSATYAERGGFAPMMSGMMGMMGAGRGVFGPGMMGSGYFSSWGAFSWGWLFMIVWWGLAIVGFGAIIKWIITPKKK